MLGIGEPTVRTRAAHLLQDRHGPAGRSRAPVAELDAANPESRSGPSRTTGRQRSDTAKAVTASSSQWRGGCGRCLTSRAA